MGVANWLRTRFCAGDRRASATCDGAKDEAVPASGKGFESGIRSSCFASYAFAYLAGGVHCVPRDDRDTRPDVAAADDPRLADGVPGDLDGPEFDVVPGDVDADVRLLLLDVPVRLLAFFLYRRRSSSIQASKWSLLDAFFICLLVAAEIYAFIILFLGYMQTLWPLRRTPVPLPDDPNDWPAC